MLTDKELRDSAAELIETWGKLFYGFWIIFLGGFVLSLKAPSDLHFWKFLGLMCFRSLAIIGTCLNFLMQFYNNRMIEKFTLWIAERESKNLAAEETRKMTHKYNDRANRIEGVLMCVGGVYLLLGLLLSFLIRIPQN